MRQDTFNSAVKEGFQKVFELVLRVKDAFSPVQPPADVEQRYEDSERAIVAAHAHGNLRIQSGEFDIKEDLDKAYERIQREEFISR